MALSSREDHCLRPCPVKHACTTMTTRVPGFQVSECCVREAYVRGSSDVVGVSGTLSLCSSCCPMSAGLPGPVSFRRAAVAVGLGDGLYLDRKIDDARCTPPGSPGQQASRIRCAGRGHHRGKMS